MAMHDNVDVIVPPGAVCLFVMAESSDPPSDALADPPFFQVRLSQRSRHFTSAADSAWSSATYLVSPTGTFNTTAPGNRPATVVDLQALHADPGSTMIITRVGNFATPAGDAYGLWGLFSQTSLQNSGPGAPQIPDAIGCGAPPPWRDSNFVDVSNVQKDVPPESFLVSDASSAIQSSITVTVPTGAKYLFLTSESVRTFFDPKRGSFGPFAVRIDYQPSQQVGGGATLLADSQLNWGDQGEGGWNCGYYANTRDAKGVTSAAFSQLRHVSDVSQTNYAGFYEHDQDAYTYTGDHYDNEVSWLHLTNVYMSADTAQDGVLDAVVARRWTAAKASKNVVITGNYTCRANSASVILAKNVTNILWSTQTVDTYNHTFSVKVGDLAAGDSIELREFGPAYTPFEYAFQITSQ